jgi:hypothetical protein
MNSMLRQHRKAGSRARPRHKWIVLAASGVVTIPLFIAAAPNMTAARANQQSSAALRHFEDDW